MYRFIVDGFLIVYQLGICCVYIMFIGTSIKQVSDYYSIHIGLLLVWSIRRAVFGYVTLCECELFHPLNLLNDDSKVNVCMFKWWEWVVFYILSVYITSIVTFVWIIFFFTQVLDIYIEPMNERYYMLIILLPLVAINLIRNLKLLAPFSQAANIITFVGLGIVLWYIFTDLPPINSRPLIGEPRKYTLFVGTTLFALEAVGVVSSR